MIVNPEVFDSSLTPTEVYQLINTLPLSYQSLAQRTHYWGRMFGVVTGEDNEQDWGDFVVNQCLRDSIWHTLRSISDEAESAIGYDVSRRYHKHTVTWPFGKKIKARPGIEKINVSPQWSVAPDLEDVVVSPFVIENVTPTLESSRYVVALDRELVDNPNDVIVRFSTHMGTISVDRGYRPRIDGTDWVITLDNHSTPWDGVTPLHIQSTKYAYVEITPPTLTQGQSYYPVFQGTNQIIPEALPRQNIGGGQVRIWFYIYNLVDKAFYNNPVNLVNAEFYKLVPTISINIYEEVEQKGRLTVTCDCDGGCGDCQNGVRVFQVTATIFNAELGVVDFCVDGEIVDEELETGSCEVPTCPECSYSLTFHYITNPNLLFEECRRAIPRILDAIMFKTAAELPMVDCGCWIDDKEKIGFIARQQETFSKQTVNAFTGTTTVLFQYGDLRGQKAYVEIMGKVPRIKYTTV